MTGDPEHMENRFTYAKEGMQLSFITEDSLFSPRHADLGTESMLSLAEAGEEDIILDLGCGYGFAGVFCYRKFSPAKLVFTDVDELAVRYAEKNALMNGVERAEFYVGDSLSAIPADLEFSMILSNPPYHTDFSIAKRFISGSFQRLKTGGRLLMVTKRREWYENRLRTVFGGVKVREAEDYYVFIAEKREKRPERPAEKTMSKKLQRKYGKSAVHKKNK
jgi:16S rRNA (guanine1207-N2)-methyltransferase